MAGRRAGFPFEDAYNLAVVTALAYLTDRRAADLAEVFASTGYAWADAYHHRRSPLQALPREVPAATGYAEPGAVG